MKSIKLIMGMPITVEIADVSASQKNLNDVFSYFEFIDQTFSTYKPGSEISKLNRGEIELPDVSPEVEEVLKLAEETKRLTKGYFNIKTPDGTLDPSGLVKGWAIYKAADILKLEGFKNFYIEAGGDIQSHGKNAAGEKWSVGIRNPFKTDEIVKVLYIADEGVATSGTYERGKHIYNPHNIAKDLSDGIISLTVIGPNIYEADRFATAAFAMGPKGIDFIEKQKGLEGYIIDKDGMATMTSGFEKYTK